MSVLYVLLPLMLAVAGGAVLAFVWAARRGQLDDLETPPLRMLVDDDGSVYGSRRRPDDP
jgi:cbb3-type cytochrome oxidase maturation protein